MYRKGRPRQSRSFLSRDGAFASVALRSGPLLCLNQKPLGKNEMNFPKISPKPFNAQRQAKIAFTTQSIKRDTRQPCAANSTLPFKPWHGIADGLMLRSCMSHHPCFQYPSCIGSENNKKAPTTVLIKGFDEGGFSVNNFEQSVIGYRDALQAHIQFHDGRIPADSRNCQRPTCGVCYSPERQGFSRSS